MQRFTFPEQLPAAKTVGVVVKLVLIAGKFR